MTTLDQKPHYIGVDVSADTLDIYSNLTGKHLKIKNTLTAINKWIKTIDPHAFLIFECTGGYEKVLRKSAHIYHVPVHIAHPNRVLYFAKGQGRKAKTDCLDAQMLALYGQKEQPEATPHPSKVQEDLRSLVTRRKQLVDLIQQEKNRCNKTVNPLVRPSIMQSIHYLTGQKNDLEKCITQMIQDHPELEGKMELLTSLKGVGIVTATTLIAALPELGQTTRNKVAALVGVAPYNQDSGKKQGRRHISGGRFEVRRALYMAATVAIRYNKILKAYYESLSKRGKCFKVAIIAVMRKMLITLNQIAFEGKKWKHA